MDPNTTKRIIHSINRHWMMRKTIPIVSLGMWRRRWRSPAVAPAGDVSTGPPCRLTILRESAAYRLMQRARNIGQVKELAKTVATFYPTLLSNQ
jgi:hypothetical protein